MDDFSGRSYGTSGLDNRPLFGETSAWVTVISSFVFPSLPPHALNIFFAVCILLICGFTLLLIFWYRQGDLEPKFRKLIYGMLASIVLLCLCANLYFHGVT
ncbi:hypothetical protein NHX12_020926 [Muraenolepis orangiensis]|uniref:Transmembrane protein 243 n=1 Tax=Muraenolepis orangiensis TaxID=630683 RepID=A0A9Q0EVT7_9TELE|nr:hypothetical protein NHX12_020926 [Muraenolepis orangiensis]